MGSHFVNVDRDTPLLLPVDLRDWVPPDDLVHFVIEAVEGMKLSGLKVNRRGSGSDQYPPKMMLSLLIYCYSMGVFSSRRIQRATYQNVCVRFLTGDTHPDHDTICAFRRENFDLVAQVFLEVLKLAREMGFLKVGSVSVDGTHVLANASKAKNIGYERAGQLQEQLKLDIADLLTKAGKADQEEKDDGQKLPQQIARREALKEKMQAARQRLEERANAKVREQRQEYERKMQDRKDREDRGDPPPPGAMPQEPKAKPEKEGSTNLTDPDSRLMVKVTGAEFKQCYNMQAAVDAGGSMLVLSTGISQWSNDAGQLEQMVARVPKEVGQVNVVTADTGYADKEVFQRMQQAGYDLYVAVGKEDNHDKRRYDYRPLKVLETGERPQKPLVDPELLAMREKLQTEAGREIYSRRKKTVEPVFGIIKSVMGFRQCLLRGLEKVRGEWLLVTLAYNFKRVWNMHMAG